MESFFRSEPVSLCQIYVQNGTAFDIVAELGELGIVSLIDLNQDVNAFQRRFTNEIMRCDTIQTRLDSILNQLRSRNIPPIEPSHSEMSTPKYKDLQELEQHVERVYEELRTITKNRDQIRQTFVHNLEQQCVLHQMDRLLSSLALHEQHSIAEVSQQGQQSMSVVAQVHVDAPLTDVNGQDVSSSAEPPSSEFNTLSGLIGADRLFSFERVLWRFFGRNIYLKTVPLVRPIETTEPDEHYQEKVFFVLYFNGQSLIRAKLTKICNSFAAQLYEVSVDSQQRAKQMLALDSSLADLRTVLAKTTDFVNRSLRDCAKDVNKWLVQSIKFRAAFCALNKFDYDSARNCLICKFWCPDKDRPVLSSVLNYIDRFNDGLVPTILEVVPEHCLETPTFFRLNKFTEGFQSIVESYGVASYQELNPAPYTVITFPFLFAVMFGDAGHGLLMALFGAWMVLYERPLAARKSHNEIWQMFFGGRYIILLMGLFAIYTGLLYNDIFAKSLNLFGSSFSAPALHGKAFQDPLIEITPVPGNYSGTPYPFGVDPVWQLSQNKILFLNSYKMKLSVLLGVMQMLFGVVLSGANHRFFRRPENLLCEFIPQLLFLCSIFGYMLVLVVVKWFRFSYEQRGDAPSILINLINMFLVKYPTDGPRYLQQWYPLQKELQTFLLVLALLCVPWILIPKVLYLRHKHYKSSYVPLGEEDLSSQTTTTSPFNLGDTFIYQAIHTIEYCLGSVSHTASYLRLWALSLAHSQLSEVLWSMVLRPGLSTNLGHPFFNSVLMLGCFAFWAFLSVAVLIVMEGLSAFLHALRLHWVEFQSKFYSGSGVKFESFSFIRALELEME